MKFFMLAVLCLTGTVSFAESNNTPQLISYYDLITLPPIQRAIYITEVAGAIYNFEAYMDLDLRKAGVASNDPLTDANPYAFEFLKNLKIADIILPSAAADSPNYPGYTCQDWTGNCNYYCPDASVVPAGTNLWSRVRGQYCNAKLIEASKMPATVVAPANKPTTNASKTAPSADGKTPATAAPKGGAPPPPTTPPPTTPPAAAAANAPAANCSSDPKVLDTGRKAFVGSQAQHPPNSCMIGGVMSTYNNNQVKRGGCKATKEWDGKAVTCPASDAAPNAAPGTASGKVAKGPTAPATSGPPKAQTLCNPMIYCKADGSVLCKPISQNTAHACADATPNPAACAKKNLNPDDWSTLASGITELCNKEGAKILYCYECSTMKTKIAAACANAKKTNPSIDCSGAGKGNQPGSGAPDGKAPASR